jgi:hypothetical protein
MAVLGFSSWARTTVTEVEGAGRRRQVSVPELLGLAEVFGVGWDALIWDHKSQGTEGVPLEVVPGFVIDRWIDLLGFILTPSSLSKVIDRVFMKSLEQQISRLATTYIERIQEVAADLRNTAGWIETKALESLNETTLEGILKLEEES